MRKIRAAVLAGVAAVAAIGTAAASSNDRLGGFNAITAAAIIFAAFGRRWLC